MNAHKASFINAAVLILMGLWGAYASGSFGGGGSPTAFIPVGIGVVLLLLNGGVKSENKVIAHIAVLLTFLTIFALGMPLKGAMGKGNTMGVVRLALMILSSIFAMVYFIKSFRDARLAREAAGE